MKARIKKTGSIVEGKTAKVFINIGIAEEIKEDEIPDAWKTEQEPILTAKEVAKLIVKCETLESLEVYKEDKRQVVKAAYNKKLKELE